MARLWISRGSTRILKIGRFIEFVRLYCRFLRRASSSAEVAMSCKSLIGQFHKSWIDRIDWLFSSLQLMRPLKVFKAKQVDWHAWYFSMLFCVAIIPHRQIFVKNCDIYLIQPTKGLSNTSEHRGQWWFEWGPPSPRRTAARWGVGSAVFKAHIWQPRLDLASPELDSFRFHSLANLSRVPPRLVINQPGVIAHTKLPPLWSGQIWQLEFRGGGVVRISHCTMCSS